MIICKDQIKLWKVQNFMKEWEDLFVKIKDVEKNQLFVNVDLIKSMKVSRMLLNSRNSINL